MKARLACVGCQAALSQTIAIQQLSDSEEARLAFVDQEPLTAPGHAFLSSQPMEWSDDEANKPPLQFAPQYWLNPADVSSTTEWVDDPRRLNGCCGPHGGEGPNVRCKNCKTEVGTRQNDCWTAHVFIPEPRATEWIEEKE